MESKFKSAFKGYDLSQVSIVIWSVYVHQWHDRKISTVYINKKTTITIDGFLMSFIKWVHHTHGVCVLHLDLCQFDSDITGLIPG